MSPGLRLQGAVFGVLALALASALALATPGLNETMLAPMHELWVAGALIAVLGMPHGALDVVFARKLFGVDGLLGWTAFSVAYVGLAALVVAIWALAPTLFLCGFLLGSAFHFGGDPAAGTSWVTRILYGGVIIVLPALMHGSELQRLLGMVAGPASAAFVAPVLAQMALPWLGASLVAGVLLARTSRLAALELAALVAMAATAPPLLSFTVYFCAMHSPRHIMRTLGSFPAAELRQTLAMALWPALAVFVGLAALAAMTALGWRSMGASAQSWGMQIMFVGLAALTLPHMLLLQRARRVGLPLL